MRPIVRFLSFLTLFFIISSTQAQLLNLGLKAGIGVSSFMGKVDQKEVPWVEHHNIASGYYAFGGFFEIKPSKKFGIYTELLLAHSGGGRRYTLTTEEVIENENFNSLQIPAMLKFKTSKVMFLGIGAQFNYLLSSSYLYRVNGSIIAEYEKIKKERNVNFTYGPAFMVGAEHDKWTFGGMLYLGISPVVKNDDTKDINLRNYNASFCVTYRLFTSNNETIQFYNHQNF
ncbi:MAG: outer membrane beta-barrel protein [Cytophagaceae bacterium]